MSTADLLLCKLQRIKQMPTSWEVSVHVALQLLRMESPPSLAVTQAVAVHELRPVCT